MDLFRPTHYKSMRGNLYCLVIVDDFTGYTWTFFLMDKSQASDIFRKFARRAKNEFKANIIKIRSDNGIEFKNTIVVEYCDKKGIKHEFSTTYTPEQNRVVERKNKTLITLARAMLDDACESFIGHASDSLVEKFFAFCANENEDLLTLLFACEVF